VAATCLAAALGCLVLSLVGLFGDRLAPLPWLLAGRYPFGLTRSDLLVDTGMALPLLVGSVCLATGVVVAWVDAVRGRPPADQ